MEQIPFGRPMIGDEEQQAVAAVLAGSILVHGPKTLAFEEAFRQFTDAPHAVAVSSCTAGMHLFWHEHGLGKGDEVVVPAQTHVATAHAVALTGARPIFVDADPVTGNMDVSRVESAITERTKGIVVVHFLGLPADMTSLAMLAKRHGLLLLEDCALSVGASLDGSHTGLWGDAGVFSFYPVKHMTTAEGGMVITRNQDLAERLRLIRAFGVNRTHGERATPGVYNVPELGFNYRMNEINAAIGIEQVKKLPGFLTKRAENRNTLADALADIEELTPLASGNDRVVHGHYCLSTLLPQGWEAKRSALIKGLKERGVGSSVYYPHPVPRLDYYQNQYGYRDSDFPSAARISDTSIALPVGPHLTPDHMKRIATAIKETLVGW
ncbi:UDP-4-amino-4-deoxy-L-arabinose--oxoglutarate aminotransferase [Magnetospira sp. QH-2]|nr:UDP-4-amino-4-deoxy-L-arabinose--oxoglutarate aminotransferase [Magnetospira sp. QH-2]